MASRRMQGAGLLLAVLVGITGCTAVGPAYEPEPLVLPEAYDAPLPALFQADTPARPWWERFDDPQLTRLVERGLTQNLDLQAASSRVREARAAAHGAGAQGELNLEGQLQRQENSQPADGSARGTTSAGMDLTALWELDLFGRQQRTREAALAALARERALEMEVTRITAAEIARAYVTLRANERQLALTDEAATFQQQTLDLVAQRVSAGLAPTLDLVRARAAVAALEAGRGPLLAQQRQQRNRLAILLGLHPGALAVETPGAVTIPVAAVGAALPTPVEAIRRRPDVQAAEFRIIAAVAEVGVATADLYPRLTLQGSIGAAFSAASGADIVQSTLGSVALLVDMPLLDGGVRRAGVTQAEERVVQAALTYRGTVLTALGEVESALLIYAGASAQQAALADAATDNRHAFEQSQALYTQGLLNFIAVLDSQRQFTDSLLQLAQAELARSLSVVDVFTAVGGSPAPPRRPATE